MYIFRKIADIQAFLSKAKLENQNIGFVPTMGALHQGHLTLINEAIDNNSIAVASIFVNPTQFNDKNDLNNYPRTVEKDIELLENAGCQVVFLPEVAELYPEGTDNLENYDLSPYENVLDGVARPGHFQGVAQVVTRLLDIVKPNNLYMGQKDYQQCMVVKKLLSTRNDQINIHFVPTKRQDDGLAMSSRNQRLTDLQKAQATLIYQCLVSIEAQNGVKPFPVVQKECIDILQNKGFEPDYVKLVDADTLEDLQDYDNQKNMIVLIAAFFGGIRLIDNLLLKSNK